MNLTLDYINIHQNGEDRQNYAPFNGMAARSLFIIDINVKYRQSNLEQGNRREFSTHA